MTETPPDAFTPMAVRPVRVVAITGAGSGIGRAMAHGFADAGYKVAIFGRRLAPLEETAAGRDAIRAFAADVADAEGCRTAFAQVGAALGPVDVLIANAAVYPRAHFLDQDPGEFAGTMRINVEGVANCIHAVLPGMLARNTGRIVVMGSMADLHPIPGAVAYSASKGALHALVKGIAAEIDRARYPNVLINELTPGPTRTAMSPSGAPPEAAFAHARRLVELPSGGPSGRFFDRGRELRLGESWKAALKRVLLRRS